MIRLNLRSHPPKLYTAEGREVPLTVGLGQREVYQQVRYRNQVPVNVIGIWRAGMREPLWVMSNLAPECALAIYFGRMKIEESFRDLKALLGLDRLMNKTQHNMEQLAALTMIAYAVGLGRRHRLNRHIHHGHIAMWIPRPLYEAIPYGYMGLGTALLAAAFFVDWGPRGLLLALGAAGLTVGLVLWMRRRDYRASQREYGARPLDD